MNRLLLYAGLALATPFTLAWLLGDGHRETAMDVAAASFLASVITIPVGVYVLTRSQRGTP